MKKIEIDNHNSGNDFISHLPYEPRVNPVLGYYSVPVIAALIARITNQQSIYTINNIGHKAKDISVVLDNVRFLEKMSLAPEYNWIDSDHEHLSFVLDFLKKGLSQGWVYVDERDVYVSDDKRVQFLDHTNNQDETFNERNRLFYIKEGQVYHKQTNERIEKRKMKCLLLKLPDKSYEIDIQPAYARKEFDELIRNFRGKDIIISRVDEKPVTLSADGQDFHIDIDVCWANFINILQEIYDAKLNTLLVANISLRQAMFTLMITDLLGYELPSKMHVLPMINVVSNDVQDNNAEYFFAKHGDLVTRLFLTIGLGSTQKKVDIPSTLAYWIQKTKENLELTDRNDIIVPTVDDFYGEHNANNLNLALKKIRQNKFEDNNDFYKWFIASQLEG